MPSTATWPWPWARVSPPTRSWTWTTTSTSPKGRSRALGSTPECSPRYGRPSARPAPTRATTGPSRSTRTPSSSRGSSGSASTSCRYRRRGPSCRTARASTTVSSAIWRSYRRRRSASSSPTWIRASSRQWPTGRLALMGASTDPWARTSSHRSACKRTVWRWWTPSTSPQMVRASPSARWTGGRTRSGGQTAPRPTRLLSTPSRSQRTISSAWRQQCLWYEAGDPSLQSRAGGPVPASSNL
mmetsp:Transcript_9691/g.30850  ORF Transcript_9691/g.30850 Transcript_9691/m.30850 type:complete len:242 (-) Transcript_9691:84-809(-)